MNNNNCVCSICGRKGVKLWRPYMSTRPLICAECAEKRQVPRECDKVIWRKENGQHVGKVTDEKISLPKWKVDKKGKIPSAFGPGPKGEPESMTDQLLIDLSRDFKSYSSGRTSMVPACPDEDGDFWGYTSVPDEVCKWWSELPTR